MMCVCWGGSRVEMEGAKAEKGLQGWEVRWDTGKDEAVSTKFSRSKTVGSNSSQETRGSHGHPVAVVAIWTWLSSGEEKQQFEERGARNTENSSVDTWLTPEAEEQDGLKEAVAHGRESSDWSYDSNLGL